MGRQKRPVDALFSPGQERQLHNGEAGMAVERLGPKDFNQERETKQIMQHSARRDERGCRELSKAQGSSQIKEQEKINGLCERVLHRGLVPITSPHNARPLDLGREGRRGITPPFSQSLHPLQPGTTPWYI